MVSSNSSKEGSISGFLFYYLPAAELVEWPRRQKSSPTDSVSMLRNRVQRTWFPTLKTESIGLGFHAWKPSSMDSFSKHRNRVHWTRFLCIKHCQFPSVLSHHSHPTAASAPHSSNIMWDNSPPHGSISPQPSTCLWVPAGLVLPCRGVS